MNDKINLTEFEDIRDEVEGVFKQVALFRPDGTEMMPYNSPKIKVDERLDEIKKRIDSSSSPKGVYVIHARYHSRDKSPAIFYTPKGDVNNITLSESQVPAPVQTAPSKPISTDKAIEISSENARLEAEVKHLKAENKILVEENAALRTDLEEMEADLADGGGDGYVNQEFWSSLAENIIPILDKHYEHKGRELQFKREQLAAQLMKPHESHAPQNGQPGGGQQPPPQRGQQGVEEIEQFRGWLDDHDIAQLYQMRMQAPEVFPDAIIKLTERYNQEHQQEGEE